jgi:uncharacterized repeat protein (TIGR02543 family)
MKGIRRIALFIAVIFAVSAVPFLSGGGIAYAAPPTGGAIVSVSVTFNPNGGTGGPGTVSCTSGAAITIPAAVPARDGYTFKGWSSASNGPVQYNPGNTGPIVVSNITLYAVWEQILPKYTVTYNANSGGGDVPVDSTQYPSGSTVNVLFSPAPARDRYNFLGWSTDPNAQSPAFVSGGAASFAITADTTLFAIWRQTFRVAYDPNGGSGGPTDNGNYYSGDSVTVQLAPEPARENFTFLGWALNALSAEPAYSSSGAKSFGITGDVILYAVWKEADKYAVTYDSAGGSGGPSDTNRYYKGTNVTVKFSPEPTKRDSTFLGWATAAGASTPMFAANGTKTFYIAASTTLYAVWKYEAPEAVLPVDPPITTVEAVEEEETTEAAIDDSPESNRWDKLLTGFSASDMKKINKQTGVFLRDLKNGSVPRGSFTGRGAWSIMNMLLSIAALILAVILIILMFAGTPAQGRKLGERIVIGIKGDITRFAAIIAGLLTPVLWLLLDRLNRPAVWFDMWTGIIMIVFAVHIALLVMYFVSGMKPKRRRSY